MDVRTAKDQDSEAIKAIVFNVLEEYGLDPDCATIDKDLDSIEDHYHNNRGWFGVVESDDGIVATVGLCRLDDNTCELRKMYVLPGQRGKGIGRFLLELSINKAKKLGYSRIVLETASPLVAAIALYERFGFKEYRPDDLSARCDQAFQLYL